MTVNIKGITSCLGYQQITSLSGSTALTVPATDAYGNKLKPTVAFIVAESQAVRWRDDGTAPTASVGMPLAVGEPFAYDGDLTRIRFIEQTASATLNIAYYA